MTAKRRRPNPLRLTEADIEAGRSPAGGFTRAQLAAWGVPWPPPKGWRTALTTGQPVPLRPGTSPYPRRGRTRVPRATPSAAPPAATLIELAVVDPLTGAPLTQWTTAISAITRTGLLAELHAARTGAHPAARVHARPLGGGPDLPVDPAILFEPEA